MEDKSLIDEDGHPIGEAFLLYFKKITENEAGFIFTPEIKDKFETHIKGCKSCRMISYLTAGGERKEDVLRILKGGSLN